MKSQFVKNVLEVFFTLVYLRCFIWFIDLFLTRTQISILVADLLSIVFCFAALIASVWLSETTVRKIKESL